MQNNFITLLPPILVIILAYLTHRVVLSLFTGLFVSSLIYNNFAILASIKNVFKTIWDTSEIGNLTSFSNFLESTTILLFLFLIILGIIISLLTYSGSTQAFQTYVNKKIKTAKMAQFASMLISNLFAIDDYFICVSVGAIMHPVTDKLRIARIKLAFIVNSLASTLAVILPISSWSATITLNISNSNVSNLPKNNPIIISDPFYLYLSVIPFIFYSFIVISGVWFIIKNDISFGPLKKHETIAKETGNLFGGRKIEEKKIKRSNNKKSHIIDFILPISLLISSIIIFILYTGNYYMLGGSNDLLKAIQEGNPVLSLILGCSLTLIFTIIFLITKKSIQIKDLPYIFWDGIMFLAPSICVLLLAWSFAHILNYQLLTGNFLASLLIKYVNIKILPVLFFIISLLTSVGISSAWGTMAIMIPIAINMLASFSNMPQPIPVSLVPMIYPVLGAILSGAVAGNHMAPVSDTIITTSRSCKIPFIDLVKAQNICTIPPLIATAFAFLIAGFLVNVFPPKIIFVVSLSSGVILNFLILKFKNKNKPHPN